MGRSRKAQWFRHCSGWVAGQDLRDSICLETPQLSVLQFAPVRYHRILGRNDHIHSAALSGASVVSRTGPFERASPMIALPGHGQSTHTHTIPARRQAAGARSDGYPKRAGHYRQWGISRRERMCETINMYCPYIKIEPGVARRRAAPATAGTEPTEVHSWPWK